MCKANMDNCVNATNIDQQLSPRTKNACQYIARRSPIFCIVAYPKKTNNRYSDHEHPSKKKSSTTNNNADTCRSPSVSTVKYSPNEVFCNLIDCNTSIVDNNSNYYNYCNNYNDVLLLRAISKGQNSNQSVSSGVVSIESNEFLDVQETDEKTVSSLSNFSANSKKIDASSYKKVPSPNKVSIFPYSQREVNQYTCKLCNSKCYTDVKLSVLKDAFTQTELNKSGSGTNRQCITVNGELPAIQNEAAEDRRESGYSSISSPSARSPLSLNSSSDYTLKERRDEVISGDFCKENLLRCIKINRFDPEKEKFLRALKLHMKTHICDSISNWTPILNPLRGVLKNKDNSLERYRSSGILNKKALHPIPPPPPRKGAVSASCLENNRVNDSEREERKFKVKSQTARIIKQVRKCLDDNYIPRGKKETKLENLSYNLSKYIPYKKQLLSEILAVSNAASKENMVEFVHILKQCDNDIKTLINQEDPSGWPAIHHAVRAGQFRNISLLIEAGSDLHRYTQKRVQEFQTMKKIVQENRNVNKGYLMTEV